MGRKKMNVAEGKHAQVQIAASAKNRLNDWLRDHPLKLEQGPVVSALVNWFMDQSESLRAALLNAPLEPDGVRRALCKSQKGVGLPVKALANGKAADKTEVHTR